MGDDKENSVPVGNDTTVDRRTEHLAVLYVQIHIGLNYGSVLLEGNDIFGDTVNTAAYLRGVARAGQILTTEQTERQLAPELRASMRPVCSTELKEVSGSSKVYEILWDTNASDLTNFRARVAHSNFTGLVVVCGNFSCRLSKDRPSLVFGRGADCDVQIEDTQVSRKHVSIRFNRDHFYLIDQSLNGTFVTLEGGEEVRLLRSEMLLERSGCFTLGRGIKEGGCAVQSGQPSAAANLSPPPGGDSAGATALLEWRVAPLHGPERRRDGADDGNDADG